MGKPLEKRLIVREKSYPSIFFLYKLMLAIATNQNMSQQLEFAV